jgi:hypothetical protein
VSDRLIGTPDSNSNVVGHEPDGRPIYRVDVARNSTFPSSASVTDVQERLRAIDPRKSDVVIWNAIDALRANPDKEVEILLAAIQAYHDQMKRQLEDNTERLMRSRPFGGFNPSSSEVKS